MNVENIEHGGNARIGDNIGENGGNAVNGGNAGNGDNAGNVDNNVNGAENVENAMTEINFLGRFHDAIHSDDSELLETFLRRWEAPENLDFEVTLSKVCNELKLNNIELSSSSEFLLEKMLVKSRFFCIRDPENDLNIEKLDRNYIVSLILFIIELPHLLNHYLKNEEIFNFILTVIAKQIFVLKNLLKSTYNRIPWEELEFCLITYFRSNTTKDELNVFYEAVLSKQIMSNMLNVFINQLLSLQFDITEFKLSELPNLTRENAKQMIIEKCPSFKPLYDYHQCVRDIHSLSIISEYVNLVSSLQLKNKNEYLVITRSLHVIGEHLKNTLESPKLSCLTSDFILSNLPEGTRNIIIQLRSSRSIISSLSLRTEILENKYTQYYQTIRNDIRSIKDVIDEILLKNKIQLIDQLSWEFINCGNLVRMESIVNITKYIDISKFTNDDVFRSNIEYLKRFIQQMVSNLHNKGSTFVYRKILLSCLDDIHRENNDWQKSDTTFSLLSLFRKIQIILENFNVDRNIFALQTAIVEMKRVLQSTPHIELKTIRKIIDVSTSIEIDPKLKKFENYDAIKKLVIKLIHTVKYGIDSATWNAQFNRNLIQNTPRFELNRIVPQKYCREKTLELKMKLLKRIFKKNKLYPFNISSYDRFKNNKKLKAIVELLVLDIFSLRHSISERTTEKEIFVFDTDFISVIGMNLRYHLDHNNVLIEVLCNPDLSLFLNAEKLVVDNIQLEDDIGKIRIFDYKQVKTQLYSDIIFICRKYEMFRALQEDDFNDFTRRINEYMDTRARDFRKSNCLHFAAKGNSIQLIEYLLDRGLNPLMKNLENQNPLHIASINGSKCVAECLCNRTMNNIDDEDYFHRTPLHLAVIYGQEDVVKLLQAQSNLLVEDFMSFTVLHYAVLGGNTEIMELFLPQTNYNLYISIKTLVKLIKWKTYYESQSLVEYLMSKNVKIDWESDMKQTLLHVAAYVGDFEVIVDLISLGADLDFRDQNGCTALHYASEMGHLQILEALLFHDANVNIRNNNNWTALHYAARWGHMGMVAALVTMGADANIATSEGCTAMHYAVESRSGVLVDTLLYNEDINPNLRNNVHYTPLHIAAVDGNCYIAEKLIEYGAKVDNIFYDESPLFLAAKNGHVKVVDLLLSKGASINVSSSNGSLPLHAAAESGNINIISTLLKLNPKALDITTRDGSHCLHVAARHSVKPIELLVWAGADINSRTVSQGFTPLHEAIIRNDLEMVECLIEHGADINYQDYLGNSPINMAIESGHTKIFEILMQNHSVVNCENNVNISSLMSAVQRNRTDIVSRLISHQLVVEEDTRNRKKKKKDRTRRIINEYEREEIPGEYRIGKRVPLYRIGKKIVGKFGEEFGNDLDNQFPMNYWRNKRRVKFCYSVRDKFKNRRKFVQNLVHAISDSSVLECLSIAIHQGLEDIIDKFIDRCPTSISRSLDKHKNTALHLTAKVGHIRILNYFIERHAQIDSSNEFGASPLSLAALNGFEEILRTLQTHGADIESKDEDGLTPLHKASKYGRFSIARHLVFQGANIKAKDHETLFPIQHAIKGGHFDVISLLIEHGDSYLRRDEDRRTLLHNAAEEGHFDIFHYLVSRLPLLLERPDLNGFTPFHIAAKFGHFEIIRKLRMEHDLIITHDAVELDKIIFDSVERGHLEVLKQMRQFEVFDISRIRNNIDFSLMHIAAQEGHHKMISYLNMINQSGIDYQDSSGNTALHIAAQEGYSRIIELLLRYKADKQIENDNNLRPLHFAVQKGFTDIVNKLQDVEDIDKIDAGRNKLLHYASTAGQLNVTKYLMNHGHDINSVNESGKTPLHLACEYDHKNVAWSLLSAGAKYNIRDNLNKTPESCCADEMFRNMFSSMTKLFQLIPRGVASEIEDLLRDTIFPTLNFKHTEHGTPLNYAVSQNRKRVVEILLINKSSPNIIEGRKGWCPLYYAVRDSRTEMVKLLLSYGAKYERVGEWIERLKVKTNIKAEIIDIFRSIEYCFSGVKARNTNVINILENKNSGTIRAILNARTNNGENLLTCAMKNNYPETEKLLNLSQNDMSLNFRELDSLCEEEQYQEALLLLEILYQNKKDRLGSGNPEVLDIRSKMGDILYKEQRYREALRVYERILNEQLEIIGYHEQYPLKTRSRIALLSVFSDENHEDTLDILEEIIGEQLKLLPASHGDVIDTKIHRIQVLRKLGRMREALQINLSLWQCFLKEESNGIDLHDLNIANNLAITYTDMKAYHEAVEIHQKVYEVKRNILGQDHKDTVKSHENIIKMNKLQGKNDELLEYYHKLLNIQEKNNDDNLNILKTIFNIGMQEFALGGLYEPYKRFSYTLEQRKKVLPLSHPDIISNMEMMEKIREIFRTKGILIRQDDSLETVLYDCLKGAAFWGDIEMMEYIFKSGALDGYKVRVVDNLNKLKIQFNIGMQEVAWGKLATAYHRFNYALEERKKLLHKSHTDNISNEEIMQKISFIPKITNMFGPPDDSSETVLYDCMDAAAHRGDMQMMEYILKNFCTYFRFNVWDHQPIHSAIDGNKVRAIEFLCRNGEDIMNISSNICTVLHVICSKGFIEYVEHFVALLGKNECLNNIINLRTADRQETPLHLAAKNGQFNDNCFEIVKILLRCGAVYNLKNVFSEKPADASTDYRITRLLILIENIFKSATRVDFQVSQITNLERDEVLCVMNTKDEEGDTLSDILIRYGDQKLVLSLMLEIEKIEQGLV